jgi:hypothetical protein
LSIAGNFGWKKETEREKKEKAKMDYMYQWFVFLWGVYALENYLNFRQWKVVRKWG